LAFVAENILYIATIVLLLPVHRRMIPQVQFVAALCMLGGGVLYRMDSYLIAYDRAGWHYFPSVAEIMITFGMIAVEVLGYILIVKFFPVLHSVEHAQQAALTSN
jgi:Ni/Fe-hydrogenase subunit HybB-like protein